MTTRDLPDWMDTIASRLAAMFGLHIWRIKLLPENASQRPDGHEHADGLADMDTNYYDAKIFLDRDLVPDVYGFEVVAHEVIHLVFADVRNVVHDIAKFVIGDDEREALFGMYDRVEEQAITRLARGMARDFDFSYWLSGDEAEAAPITPKPPSDWWLIGKNVVDDLRRELALFDIGDSRAGRIRYLLDTGLHTTDAVPSDFTEDAHA